MLETFAANSPARVPRAPHLRGPRLGCRRSTHEPGPRGDGVNGFSVARPVRAMKRQRNVSIVAVSALTSEAFRKLALDPGCDAFLGKLVVAATGATQRLKSAELASEGHASVRCALAHP